MASGLQKSTYGVAVIPIVLQAVWFVTEQYAANTNWWTAWVQTWPMRTIWFTAMAFIAGLLIQDMLYPNSWIKKNWRDFTNKFEIVWLNVSYSENPRRLEVNVRIRFVRPIKSASLSLRIHSCTGMNYAPHIHPIHIENLSNIMKDEQRIIKIATLVISHPGWIPFHSTWGNSPLSVDLNSPSLVGRSKNVVYLELTGPMIIPQRHKFFVANLDYAAAHAIPAIYAQDEDEDIFKI